MTFYHRPYETYSAPDFAADESFIEWVNQAGKVPAPFWENWVAEHPEKQAEVAEARKLVQLIQFPEPADTAERVRALWTRIAATNAQPNADPAPPVRPLLAFRTWQRIAAALVGILLVSVAAFFALHKPGVYRTAYGETKEVFLPDGSVVILNANSTLKLSQDWETSREVWLTGEAFFRVKKQPIPHLAPGSAYAKFTVHTGSVRVQVLGTEFNVSDRRQHTVVVLNSGKIQLSRTTTQESIVMQPGDLVEVTEQTDKLTKKRVNPVAYSAWTSQEWVLDNLSLPEVAAKIEETYGVKVVIKNPAISHEVVTGSVPVGNLDNLLEALSATFAIKITREGDQIFIE